MVQGWRGGPFFFWGRTPMLDAKDNPKTKAFLDAIEYVCRQHGYSIAHEDGHGAFVVAPMSEQNIAWLHDANDETGGQ